MNPKDRIGITKVPLSLLPPVPKAHTAMALLEGRLKYGLWNWRQEKVAASVYLDAAMRHISDWADLEEEAADSGVHHLGHACACLFIIMDAQRCGNLIDDRAKSGSNCSKLFTELTETVKALYAKHGQDVPATPSLASMIDMGSDDMLTEKERKAQSDSNFSG